MRQYSADKPAQRRSEDVLGRASFADSIADSIVNWRENSSLVLTLTGNWGSGKTTLKNFILERLSELENGADPIELNPWSFSGTRDLEQMFFDRVGAFLGRRDGSALDRSLARKWDQMASAFGLSHAVFEPAARVVLGFAVAGGVFAAISLEGAWAAVGVTIVVIAFWLNSSEKVARRAADLFRVRSERTRKGFEELKKEVAGLLQQRENPLLVVIDDIDRLTPDEMRLMFRLVSANADLPRVLYLLIFDYKVVVQLLEGNFAIDGRGYLEKIVQVRFEVPPIDRTRLLDVVYERLNEILILTPDGAPFDERRWTDLFVKHLQEYFQTLRDVHRFLNAFEFQVGLYCTGNSCDVNVVDLFALESLRIFEPSVYEKLPRHELLLTSGKDASSADAKTAIKTIVDGSSAADHVTAILGDLFPRTSWAFGGPGYHSDFNRSWARDRRVCTELHFKKYFLSGLSATDISQHEIEEFFAASADRSKTRSVLDRLNRDGRLLRFLSQAQLYAEDAPAGAALQLVTALFDVGESLPEKESMWSADGEDYVRWMVESILASLEDRNEAADVVAQAVRLTEGLHAPVYLLWFEERVEELERKYVLPEERVRELQNLCVAKIATSATSGHLLEHRQLPFLLYRWSEWGGAGRVREWCAEVTRSADGVVKFLSRFVSHARSQGFGSVVEIKRPFLTLKSLEDFVDLPELEKALLSGRVEEDPQTAEAVELFISGMERRRNGLPDADPGRARDWERT